MDKDKEGMTFIVKTITRIVIGFIILFGFYIILYGHLTPGGGFAGGVIIATGYVLLTLGFSKERAVQKMPTVVASVLDNFGALSFWLIAILGLITGGYFFFNFIDHGTPFRLFSAGTIPLSNIAIGLKVAFSLFIVFLALSLYGKVGSEDLK